MKDFNGRTVLLIAPKFFGYEKRIQENLCNRGADVVYLNADPNNFLMTVVAAFNRFGLPYNWLIHLFESKCYRKVRHLRFDYILIICGWAITSSLVKRLKVRLLKEDGKSILYYWDSICLLNDDVSRIQLFDRVYSFDKRDCAKFANINFLPLFFCEEYHPLHERIPHKYNLMTVGSYKHNRYFFLKSIKERNPDITVFSFMYLNKWLFYFHKFFRKKMKEVRKEDISFYGLTKEEIMELYKDCDAVLDIPKTGQEGLTMRIFECLAMQKKIVTTNASIVDYDFYDPLNVFVLDSTTMELPSVEWFQREYNAIPESVVANYSISKWLDCVFN